MDYILPRGWQWVRLAGIAQVIRGVTFDRNDATDSASEDTVPILRAGNINGDLVTDRDLVWVPSSRVGLEQLMQVGDVAICMSSGSADVVGKTAQLRAPWMGSVGAFCALIRPTSPVVDTDYFGHVFTSPVFTFWRRRQSMGANIQNLRLSDVESVMIPVPPLSEQRRIVEILNEARDIRRLRQQADQLTTQLIPAIFNEMFGDPLLNPKEWPIEPISRTYQTKPNYGTMTPADPSGDGVVCIRVGDIQDNQLDLSNAGLVPLDSFDGKRHLVKTGDVLLVRAIGSIDHLGKSVVIEESEDGIAFDSHLMRVRFNQQKVLPHFIHSLFITPGGRRLFLKNTRQSAVQVNINTDEYGRIRIPLPPTELQELFVDRVKDVRKCLQQQYAAEVLERKTHQSLLAYAFSGELTAEWRESHLEQLTQEATERDEWLRENGVKLSIPDRRMQDRPDENDGRLAELNREQRKLLEQIQNLDPNENGGTFTLSSLESSLNEPLDSLPVDAVRRHLDVLAARGLIKAISRRAGAGGSVNVAFGNLYRQPLKEDQIVGTADEPDFQRLSELDRLSRQRQPTFTGSGNITLPGVQMTASGTVSNPEGDD